MAKGKKTGGRNFEKNDPRRKVNARAGTGVPIDIRLAAKLRTSMALDTLERAMKNKKPGASAVTAALAIIDRAYGKIPQPIEVTEIPIVNDDIRDRPDKTDDND